jgi:hypothetical protein
VVCKRLIFCRSAASADFFVPTRKKCAEESAPYECGNVELTRESRIVLTPNAGVAELADALDSKSSGRKVVWVRAPPPAMNSQFDVRCRIRAFDRAAFGQRTYRFSVALHPERNGSTRLRTEPELCSQDISAAQFPR